MISWFHPILEELYIEDSIILVVKTTNYERASTVILECTYSKVFIMKFYEDYAVHIIFQELFCSDIGA